MRTINHFINGQRLSRTGMPTSPVYDPSTGRVQAHLEHGDAAILAEAVAIAKSAQRPWAAITPQHRARFHPRADHGVELRHGGRWHLGTPRLPRAKQEHAEIN